MLKFHGHFQKRNFSAGTSSYVIHTSAEGGGGKKPLTSHLDNGHRRTYFYVAFQITELFLYY
jgi:hypothetical protein